MPEMSDNEMRKLFQQAGRPPLRTDLSDRIMARVSVTPIHRPIEVKPLIGKAGWFAIVVGFIGLLVFLLNVSGISAGTPSILDPLWRNAPQVDLPRIALPTGQWPIWTAVIAGCVLIITVMDRAVEKVVR